MTGLSYLRVWGFLVKVLVPEHKKKKLGPKTVDCIFLGYLKTTTTMRFLVLKSNIYGIVANTIVEFRDTTLFEEVFPIKTGISLGSSEDDLTHRSSSIPDHVKNMTNMGVDPDSSSTPNEVEEPRRSKRAKVVKDFGSDFITYNVEDEHLTFHQTMDSSKPRHWKGAVKSEIDSIVSNGTWELVDLPPECSTIGCKWIFKRKLNPDGSIDKYKARLVAKGFSIELFIIAFNSKEVIIEKLTPTAAEQRDMGETAANRRTTGRNQAEASIVAGKYRNEATTERRTRELEKNSVVEENGEIRERDRRDQE
ncbi:hypothetical protein AgCh_024935 [Apium graveolens]